MQEYFTFKSNAINSNLKSGPLGEKSFDELINDSQLIQYTPQYRLKIDKYDDIHSLHIQQNIICDFISNHEIIEIKNIMGSGTAYEKILYTMLKYLNCVDTFKNHIIYNVKIVLCRDFEHLIIPIVELMIQRNLLQMFNDNGIYLCLFSTIINDFYNINNMSNHILKWVGGKTKLLPKINPIITQLIQTNHITTYIEPFVGGGSSLFNAIRNYNFNTIIAADINNELIILYKTIQHNISKLIECLELLKCNITEDEYYDFRNEYNLYKLNTSIINKTIKNKTFDRNVYISALFIILNKSSFRGLYRVNKNNEYNVPYGNYKKISIFTDEYYNLLRETSKLIKNVQFICCDYNELLDSVEVDINETLFYLDPPYLNTFDSYQLNSFDSKEFSKFISDLPIKIVSNNEVFYNQFSKLFKHVEYVDVNDSINSKKPQTKRKEVICW